MTQGLVHGEQREARRIAPPREREKRGERSAGHPNAHHASWLDRRFREALHARLRRIERGSLTLVDGGGTARFGAGLPGPEATIRVEHPDFYRYIATRGGIGGAEAWMEGLFDSDDLTEVIRVIALNRKCLDHLDGAGGRLLQPALRLLHRLRHNDRDGSRRNIAAHYDLGNDFFRLFLDPTLTYSCGIFEREDASMEEASVAKYERLCRKLELGPQDHVLEIGTGWGGFAIHAATRHGCRVTTTTISREQHDLARERIRAAGVGDRVELLFEDYRDLRGSYDKLVSIEMIEAVGHENWDDYFRVCGERLRPEGMMALQAISIRDQDFASSKKSVDFIKRYIFPGGQLVSHAALCQAMARASDLHVTHFEDITTHYTRTLASWRRRMLENLDRMRAMGLTERFLRMWEYYLCYCEGSFAERATYAFQMVFEKPLCRREPLLGSIASAQPA